MPASQEHKKILFVLTSHDRLGGSGEKTGFHWSEMTDPYFYLQDNGVEVTLASIKGGEAPADPASLRDEEGKTPESVTRFHKDAKAMKKLKSTLKVDDVKLDEYDGIYLPGGHGTMWDFPRNAALIHAIEQFWADGKIVAAVCHGPAAFLNACDEKGKPLVKGRMVNSYTNDEETESGKDAIVPFMLETELRRLGGLFESDYPWAGIVVRDGQLMTGQNPKSALPLGRAILSALGLTPHSEEEEVHKTRHGKHGSIRLDAGAAR